MIDNAVPAVTLQEGQSHQNCPDMCSPYFITEKCVQVSDVYLQLSMFAAYTDSNLTLPTCCHWYLLHMNRVIKYVRAVTTFKVNVEWPWRYRSRSKVITCNKPSHASDHLYQIWKESIQNCRCCRANTIFKIKAEWPWKCRSRSKVITWDTPSDANDDLCQIWKEYKQNCRFFSRWKPKKICEKFEF